MIDVLALFPASFRNNLDSRLNLEEQVAASWTALCEVAGKRVRYEKALLKFSNLIGLGGS